MHRSSYRTVSEQSNRSKPRSLQHWLSSDCALLAGARRDHSAAALLSHRHLATLQRLYQTQRSPVVGCACCRWQANLTLATTTTRQSRMASEPLTAESEDFLTERSTYSGTSDVARLRQARLLKYVPCRAAMRMPAYSAASAQLRRAVTACSTTAGVPKRAQRSGDPAVPGCSGRPHREPHCGSGTQSHLVLLLRRSDRSHGHSEQWTSSAAGEPDGALRARS